MAPSGEFVDVHCHLLPGIDDGPQALDESLALAAALAADGVRTAIVAPHQLGPWRANRGPEIRRRTVALQAELQRAGVPLTIHPGGCVRIEPQLARLLRRGDVLSLADRRRQVLLELPPELYFSFEVLLQSLHSDGLAGVLAHPELNTPIQRQPGLLEPLVQAGCLLQVAAGSVLGRYGAEAQRAAEDLLDRGWVQLVGSDARDCCVRAPALSAVYERLTAVLGEATAWELCTANPARVVAGEKLVVGARSSARRPRTAGPSRSWLGWAASAFVRRSATAR